MKSLRTLTALAVAISVLPASALRLNTPEPVVTGPGGVYPYFLKGSAEASALAPDISSPNWSLLAHSRAPRQGTDTLHVIAFMVEFNGGRPDSLIETTGTGLFNIWSQGSGTVADVREYTYYTQDTVYRYDNLDHYQRYFENHFEFARRYYEKVSSGKFTLKYDVYPKEYGRAYNVSKPMTYYSPGGKRSKESWDEYYFRKTKGLMEFIVEAVRSAHTETGAAGSPFAQVQINADGKPVDLNGNPVAFMVIHAGASYLTDGGESGAYGADSPSDMIDAFISPDFFNYYRGELQLDSTGTNQTFGVKVRGASGDMLVRELMMLSETSNQDGLNWGINGILINQIARQLGIPDLFSTSSGISGIGAFCIMDFAGYSAAQGFIPPWPSAWVRAFMGWDTPVVAPMGVAGSYRVKSPNTPGRLPSDTTILLVPINDHEYYLIENRQRNPEARQDVFRTDTTSEGIRHLASYPYNVVLPKNVTDSTGTDTGNANVILDVYNYDVGIPASGVVVWHIDEQILKTRLRSNLVNADSLYRGVSLVEADGINDLGIMFADAFYNAVFDWGGPEDIFPHRRLELAPRYVDSIGPFTRPSTRSNDGGQTYLSMRVRRGGATADSTEKYAVRDYFVQNYTDSVFSIDLSWSFLSPGWPRRIAPDSVFDPLAVNLATQLSGKEIVVVGKSGRVHVLPAQPDSLKRLNPLTALIPVIGLLGDTLKDSSGSLVYDTAGYAAFIDRPLAMPSLVGERVFIPAADKKLYVLRGIDGAFATIWDTLTIAYQPRTPVCGLGDSLWAVGCDSGIVLFGAGGGVQAAVFTLDTSRVTAVAAIPGSTSRVAAVQNSGRVSVVSSVSSAPPLTVTLQDGIGPYALVSGDIDANDSGAVEFVVCDSRQGLWMLSDDLTVATGWSLSPNDWASAYATTESGAPQTRTQLPYNPSSPSLADINGDGRLDIIVGGTNGVYALNYKGVLIKGWPYYLDNRYWLQRGSVSAAPVAARDGSSNPLLLFSSSSGDNPTFSIARITATNDTRTKVYFRNDSGVLDSIWGLAPSLVDSILRYNDSLIAPYVLPGGYIDAINASAKRPLREIASLPNVGRVALYDWPITTGATVGTSPMICDLDSDDTADVVAISASGWVFRWELPSTMLQADSTAWRMAGYGPSRSFAYLGALGANTGATDTVGFYCFPNPAKQVDRVVFRYAFSSPAKNVSIDIFTYTGHNVYSWKEPSGAALVNYPDWNEHPVSITGLGPAVYRCRLGATVNGKEISRFWKLAIVK